MFDKLDDILIRLEEVLNELNEPTVANDTVRFQKLMKEQSDLQPIVDAYKEYKDCKQTVEDSVAMLEEESDEEMREMLKEELSDAKKRIEELEESTDAQFSEIYQALTQLLSKPEPKPRKPIGYRTYDE